MAVGVSLTFSVLRFANFAHVQFAVVGGYLTYVFSVLVGLPIVAALLSRRSDRRARGAGRSRGFPPAARHLAGRQDDRLLGRGAVHPLDRRGDLRRRRRASFALEPKALSLGGAYFTSLDVVCVAATIVAMVALHLLLYRTRVGTALRALASNPDLAVTPRHSRRAHDRPDVVHLRLLRRPGRRALRAETRLQPNMDLIILLPIFAAVTIGGLEQCLRRGGRRADPVARPEPADLRRFRFAVLRPTPGTCRPSSATSSPWAPWSLLAAAAAARLAGRPAR